MPLQVKARKPLNAKVDFSRVLRRVRMRHLVLGARTSRPHRAAAGSHVRFDLFALSALNEDEDSPRSQH